MNRFLRKRLVLAATMLGLMMMLSIGNRLYGQSQVSGYVFDSNGDPLPGVSVLIKGSNKGVVSDLEGRYSLIASPEDVLVFSFIGYKTKEMVVGSSGSDINIRLALDEEQLDEIVVIGYGSQQKEDVSSAISSVSSEDIARTLNPRLENALQGKVAGIQVIANSGAPGSGLTVTIRGTGSFNGAEPLYVVDGMILQSGGLEYLSSNDIASVHVLKDAASSSIYGARGSNGVVLVTTKSGEARGTPGTAVSFNAYTGVQQIGRRPDMMNAREYILYAQEAIKNDGGTIPDNLSDPEAYGEGTDWIDEIGSDNAAIQEYNFSVANNYETGSYYFSSSYFKQDGIFGGDKSSFDRYTFLLNTQNNVSDRFKVGSSLIYSHYVKNEIPINNESSPFINALNYDPITRARFKNGAFMGTSINPGENKNPASLINYYNGQLKSDRMLGRANLSYEVVDGLFLESTAAVDFQMLDIRNWSPAYRLYNEFGGYADKDSKTSEDVQREFRRLFAWQLDFLARYKTRLGTNGNLEVAVGMSLLEDKEEDVFGRRVGARISNFDEGFLDNGTDGPDQETAGGFTLARWRSFFGRALYDYKDKYFLTLSMRSDESSRFGPNNRRGYFPAISGAWKLSSETFFDISKIDFLKLRAGWGQNGSDAGAGEGAFLTTVNSQAIGVGGKPSIAPSGVSNPNLKWETGEQINIGFDIEALDHKLFLQMDYFVKDTKDLLAETVIPKIVGVDPPKTNSASVRNKGIELLANYSFTVGSFKFDFGANYARVKNEVTDIAEGVEIVSNSVQVFGSSNLSVTKESAPIAGFYGLQTNGLFQSDLQAAEYTGVDTEGKAILGDDGLTPKRLQPDAVGGDVIFVDQNKDGAIDEEDRILLGQPIPTDFFAFSTSIAYKNFDIYMFLQGAGGNSIVNATVKFQNTLTNRPKEYSNFWTTENKNTNIPRPTYDDFNRNKSFSDRYVEKGDFLRFKTLSLGYSVPAYQLSKINLGVKKVRIYISATNLFTFTSYSGLDPEIGTKTHDGDNPQEIGVDVGFYPQARTFIGGIQIGL